MPFTTEEFHDLVRLVETHPEWRAELRRLVLTDEILLLPEQLTALRVRSEQQFQALIEAQQRTEARLDALAEAQQRTEARLDALAEAQQRTEAQITALTVQVTSLARAVHGLTDDVGDLKGINLEMTYRFKGPAYFSRIIRRAHVLTADEVVTLIEDARERGILSDAEADDLTEVDLVVRGRRIADRTEIYLAVEVSWGVGPHDVERAAQRASLLARTGVTALPVVAGNRITTSARRLANHRLVWQLIDRQVVSPGAEED